jgi:hypothetical protein
MCHLAWGLVSKLDSGESCNSWDPHLAWRGYQSPLFIGVPPSGYGPQPLQTGSVSDRCVQGAYDDRPKRLIVQHLTEPLI